MRFLISILLIAAVAGLVSLFFPWWVISPVTFLVAFFSGLRPAKSFLAGFLGIALLWAVVILWKDIANEHILSSRMAGVFGLSSYPLFILVNIVLGGIVGGMSAWCSGLLRSVLYVRTD